jgi:hypothetical protein
MAAASWGHATFFLLSQSHAGEVRASAVPVVSVPAHRTLTAVMADRASVAADLAVANARHCIRDCPALRIRRTSLAARLDALDAEAPMCAGISSSRTVTRARRDAARDDPVTARLAVLRGVANARLDLFAGLAFAAVLEGVACLLWWIALLPHDASPVTDRHEARIAVMANTPAVTIHTAATTPAVTEPDAEVTKLRRAIEAGAVKPTVAGIRRNLGCSQAKAAALRKLVIDPTA